jgi:hypothetical protein
LPVKLRTCIAADDCGELEESEIEALVEAVSVKYYCFRFFGYGKKKSIVT